MQLDAQAEAPNHSEVAGRSAASAPGYDPLAGIMGAIAERVVEPPSAPMASPAAGAAAFPAAVHRSKSKVALNAIGVSISVQRASCCTVKISTTVCLPQFAQRRQRSQQQPQQEPPLAGPPPSGSARLDDGLQKTSVPHARDASSSEGPSERAQIDAENRARLAQMDPAEVSHIRPLMPLSSRLQKECPSTPTHVRLVTAARRTTASALCTVEFANATS